MLDLNTFLTTLYVMADDFCKQNVAFTPKSGPKASLEPGEVVTLALFAQFWWVRGERPFNRYVNRHLRPYFPHLPDRAQFNRLVRQHWHAIVAFWQAMVDEHQAQQVGFEVLDSVPVPVRNIKRRGWGCFAGQARIGWGTRLGWYLGFHGLIAVNPSGVITGFAFGGANEKDQPLADTFLALRRFPHPVLPAVGRFTAAYYLADNGFEGSKYAQRWNVRYGAMVLAKPAENKKGVWPKSWNQWLKGLRQIVETVYDKLENWFGLGRDRNHDLTGFHARFAMKVALPNFLIYLNRSLGRPALAFADLLDW